MQCGHCGERVTEGAHFCGQCGARLDAAPSARAALASLPTDDTTPHVASSPPAGSPPSAESAPLAAPSQDLIGRTIAGRYRLLRQVGEGEMGRVYEAEQALGSSVRSVAVKLLGPEWSHDPSIKARFNREAETVARLEHFNTVRVYDYGATEDGTLFIVMEFLQGASLRSILDEQGALPPDRVEHIVRQAAASLEEAHHYGIVHRDLRPDNILLIEEYAGQLDVVKLVDFGIAKGQAAPGDVAATRLTDFGAFVGTPAYMSPEQFTGSGVGPGSDIYSLGVTTYQMLTGRLPFDAETALDWARAHTSASPLPISAEHGAGPIPESMRRAVSRALSKDPAERQASAAQFSSELSDRSGPGSARASLPPRAPPAVTAQMRASLAPDAVASDVHAPDAAASGGMKTAPMVQLPEFSGPPRESSGVRPTLPMAAARVAPPPREDAPAPRRRWVWASLLLVTCAGLSLLFFALMKNRDLGPWQLGGGPDVAPPPLVSATPSGTRSPPAPAPSPPEEPERVSPAPRASAPSRPPSSPATPPPVASPQPSPGTPTLPGLPSQLPPVGSTPTQVLPPGAPLPTLPTLPQPPQSPPTFPAPPQLPWNIGAAGACARCLEELKGSGHYTVVSAVGQALLCDDRVARETCERLIGELAPALAEKAAREGDCPAAWATVAAAVNVRVPPDRFQGLDALCLR